MNRVNSILRGMFKLFMRINFLSIFKYRKIFIFIEIIDTLIINFFSLFIQVDFLRFMFGYVLFIYFKFLFVF